MCFTPKQILQVIDLAANNLTSLDYRISFPLNNIRIFVMTFNKLSTVDDQSAKWMLDIETAINLTGTCQRESLTVGGVVVRVLHWPSCR
jgi:hypothetical protein